MQKDLTAGYNRRTVLRWSAAGTAMAVMGGPVAAQASSSRAEEGLRHVAPDLREAAARIITATQGFYPMSAGKLPLLRSAIKNARLPTSLPVPLRTQTVSVGAGRGDVLLYILNARADAPARPAILHTHGGGFITGSALLELLRLASLAQELDCVIVSVEYALAPEAVWHHAIEQTYAGLRWLHASARTLGVDPSRIAVMGESAGGGHAALLALTARDRGEVPLAFQCLIYPMLDDRTGTTRFPPPGLGCIGWDADANHYGWRAFLGQEPGTAKVPDHAVPARAKSLAGLPPTFIGVGAIDLFAREDIAYAQRLTASGVAAELLVLPGAFHGFDAVVPGARASREISAAKLSALRGGLGIADR
ncbi:MAG: alpha/beta hydrolase [Sphingomonadales bacterium]|nr:alpha/beta hydrolase [Sphingomonadales bacterium]MDE2169884.1 alpha/beta hydrolase [Sphingomonadales bacterium]